MAKRFTDTTKWEDPWYRKLPSKFKVAWEFLRDKVDNAGFWKKDFEVMSFFTRETYTQEDLLYALNDGKERVKDHGDHWELVDFVSFQYGVLSNECHPHKSIIALRENYKKKGYCKGTITLQDKTIQDKDKDKDKKKEFFESLKTNPAYAHINLDIEFAKMDQWLMKPCNNGRRKTPSFILNWLNKIEAPVSTPKTYTAPKKDETVQKMEQWKKEAAPMPEECKEQLKKFGIRSTV